MPGTPPPPPHPPPTPPTLCAAHDGIALQRASAEQQTRYPSCPQARVVTLGSETWGRLSEEREHILALCAASAARRDHRRGRLTSTARLRIWRASLDGAHQAAIAAQREQATAGLHGRAHARRRRCTDLGALELAPAPIATTAGISHALRPP